MSNLPNNTANGNPVYRQSYLTKAPKLPKVPDIIQGAPVLMSLLRNSIGYVAAAGAAAIAGFLNAKGFNASWFYPYLPYFIALALIAGATFIWSLVTSNAKANQFVLLIEKVLEAAQTGQVPAAVQAITPPQMKLQVAVVAQEQADPQKRLPLK